MRRISKISCLFLLFAPITPLLVADTPKVCLNMIVKDETHVIKRCLDSVMPFIDYWVIVDTGSSDGTQEMIKEHLKDIPGELHERPWVNFSHNRNEALTLAMGKSDYIFFIDADDLIVISETIDKNLLDKDIYYLKIHYNGTTYTRPHMIRSHLACTWIGAVHEGLYCSQGLTSDELEGITLFIVGGGDRSLDTTKFLKDALTLEIALNKDPNNPRDVFYLGQSYRDAGLNELALKAYKRRVEMGGWDQEVFWSLYQMGVIHERLNSPREVIVDAYTQAYEYRPTRIEPLFRLCNYYRREKNYLLGYLVAEFALKTPDTTDGLFVESWIYRYGVLLEYSICAYWIGEYEESLRACDQLLALPNLPPAVIDCTLKNREFAKQRLGLLH